MKSSVASAPFAASLLLLALGACASRPSNLSVTDRETIAACRTHADQVYERLNRGAIYSINQSSTPNSAMGLVGDPTAALSDRYARDRMIERCVRGVAPGGNGVGGGVAPSFSVPASLPAR